MFQNVVIDIAIGLVLMYLVLSLLCTVLNEYIATWVGLRASTLKNGLKELIDVDSLRETFNEHGLIKGIRKATGGEHPSYISGKDFVTAIIDSLDPKNPVAGISEIKDGINKLPVTSDIRDILLANLTAAETAATAAADVIKKFRENLAAWFDDAMDRISGVYKRNLKWISLGVGIALAITLNADSLRVGKVLWGDPTLRTQVAGLAEQFAASCKPNCVPPADKLGKTEDTIPGDADKFTSSSDWLARATR